MKDLLRSGLLLVVVLALAACGAGGAEVLQTTSSTSVAGADAVTTGVELTDEMKLMLGTMKLDEVGLAPDAAQASELLVLWQAYQSLVTSDTAAAQELEAVLAQVDKSMSAEQIEAIAGMDLDRVDLTGFMEAYRQEAAAAGEDGAEGFSLAGPGGQGGQFTPPDDGSAPPARGFVLEGGGGGPGFGSTSGGGTVELSPEALATAQAVRAGGFGDRAGLFLLRPLIAELQALAGA